MLDLRRLKILREFAEHGTIAGTAQALGYTASAVSQQLSALEREVSASLLDRTARSAELTDTGRLLAEQAEQILALVEAAESALAAQTDVPRGRVTVTAFPTAAVAFAPKLAEILRRHERMQLVLRQAMEGTGAHKVSAGEIDVAVVDDWSGLAPDTRAGKLRHIHLLRDPMVLALPADHPLADPRRPVDLHRLRDEAWIAAPHGEPSRQGTDRLLADIGGAPSAAWEFEGLGTILSLVARGIGIAAVPALALVSGSSGLAYRRFPEDAPSRDIYAVIRASSLRRPSIDVTLRALLTAASEMDETLSDTLESEGHGGILRRPDPGTPGGGDQPSA
ncbi:LysR family transcriptional regulator [Nocardiopsis gilva YIM 90087]|uniref:LysR family transcriptional regulator n=1 Tax=Nocardiopsis gilva YIM 90087 TaxID=1235441 RepID=A0A223SA87_9ACTN|nr:LysR family transcriptional regulator [Nocardiopsis gilva]ASU84989.1 LysR family transcriptional regulator [Nocardiopsis gilva YIM 90087]